MVVKFSIAHSLLFFLFPAPLIEIVVLNRFGDVTQPYRQFLKFPLCCIESRKCAFAWIAVVLVLTFNDDILCFYNLLL